MKDSLRVTRHVLAIKGGVKKEERRKQLAYIRECKELDEQFAIIKTSTYEKKRKCHRR